jgi:hypothetical protein
MAYEQRSFPARKRKREKSEFSKSRGSRPRPVDRDLVPWIRGLAPWMARSSRGGPLARWMARSSRGWRLARRRRL